MRLTVRFEFELIYMPSRTVIRPIEVRLIIERDLTRHPMNLVWRNNRSFRIVRRHARESGPERTFELAEARTITRSH